MLASLADSVELCTLTDDGQGGLGRPLILTLKHVWEVAVSPWGKHVSKGVQPRQTVASQKIT